MDKFMFKQEHSKTKEMVEALSLDFRIFIPTYRMLVVLKELLQVMLWHKEMDPKLALVQEVW